MGTVVFRNLEILSSILYQHVQQTVNLIHVQQMVVTVLVQGTGETGTYLEMSSCTATCYHFECVTSSYAASV